MKLPLTENIKFSQSKINIDEYEKGLERIVDNREFAKSVNSKLASMGIKLNYNGH